MVAALLLIALGLVAWLGYEAVDAAASHRRTAESVLRDYALVSATELARVTESRLDDLIDEVVLPVLRRSRSRGVQPPSAVAAGMGRGAREADCSCPSLRSPLFFFRIDPDGAVLVEPGSGEPPQHDRLAKVVAGQWRPPPGTAESGRSTLAISPGGGLLDEPVALAYLIAETEEGAAEPIFGFGVSMAALQQLLTEWYGDLRLLPQAVVGDVPNDSLLSVTMEAPNGVGVFASPVPYPSTLGARVPVPGGARYGNLVVNAAVRPDAAPRLIIGGLPNSRLPLLVGLLLLTLGLGGAAIFQLRREQTFQRLREDFVSGVSHELRTPLAQIRVFSELQEAGKLTSEEDQRRATSVIAREARRLSHLVDNILQFSGSLRTWREMPRERVDLGQAILEGLDSVTPLLEHSAMSLEIDAEPHLWVNANAEALTRVVVNLLDNAIKYGPRGQTVRVGVGRVDGTAHLSVEDEGPGVPPADRDRVWKAYRRLDRDVRARVPGSGIGLAVVHELTSVHGGRAWVDAAPGGGARFTVALPLADIVAPSGEPTNPPWASS